MADRFRLCGSNGSIRAGRRNAKKVTITYPPSRPARQISGSRITEFTNQAGNLHRVAYKRLANNGRLGCRRPVTQIDGE
jgi:hypothetical protein